MRKYLALFVVFHLFLLLSCKVVAQLGIVKKPGVTVGANFVYAMPQGQFKDRFKLGVGGEAYAGVGFGSTFIIATVGVTSYVKQPNVRSGITAVPLKIGLKKYLLLKRLFVNADLGSTSVKFDGASSSAFTVGFGGGVKLLGAEAGLYYNAFKNTYPGSPRGYANSLNAKVGWNFTL